MKIEPLLNRNLILEKTENIYYEINKPKFEKIVLHLDKDYEKSNGYFTILYINNEYKLYYRSCSLPVYKDKINKIYYGTEELAEHEYFCLATSIDGLNFEKKKYNITNYNNSIDNNILKHDFFCHNFYPFYDKKNNKYIAISGVQLYNNGIHLFESLDGINWIYIKKILDESYILPGWNHNNHYDSLNCIVYNEKEDNYYIYLRDNKHNQRFVQYSITKDFNEFSKCKNIDINNNNDIILYTPGIFKYENTDYYLSIPSVNYDNIYGNINNSTLMISINNINFNILTKDLFEKNNKSSMNINSIVSSSNNLKMYIYSHCNLTEDQYISCHSFEIDRIQKIICHDFGFIKTDLIQLFNKLYINYETFNKGYLDIELINKEGIIVLNSIKIYNHSYNYEVIWKDEKTITPDFYYIKFNMYNCNLYSFYYD